MTRKMLHEENSRTILTIYTTPSTESKTLPQYVGATFATLCALACGACLSWTSPAIPMLQLPHSNPKITDEEGSWIGSLLTLGACIGAIPAGYLAVCFGRKRFLQMLAAPIFLSWMLIAFSGNVWGYYTARFLAGMAIGAVSVAAPMYVAEIAERRVRGTLGTFFQLQITVGLLLGYILGGTVSNFKILALISSLLPVVFLALFSFIPESPVFYINSGDIHKARMSLQWFRGPDYDIEDELRQIRDGIKKANANRASISDLVKCKSTTKALIISLGLMVFQQLSGINAVLFYAGKIFKESGSSISPDTCAILIGAVQVVATFTSTLLIDRAGRKILLTLSASVMCICLAILGTFFHLQSIGNTSNYALVPIISIALYIVVFSVGFGPIPWMMIGELFPNKLKGVAGSVSAAFNWILAFTVTKLFVNMLNVFGSGATFGVFSVICAFGTAFVVILVPETKGKDIDEVQELLLGIKRQTNLTVSLSDTDGININIKK